VAQKVSHYQESSLNRVKIAIAATFFIDFEYKNEHKNVISVSVT